MVKAAGDTVPRVRWKLVQQLSAISGNEYAETKKLAAALWLPENSTRRVLGDLLLLKIVDRQKVKKGHFQWRLAPEARASLDRIQKAIRTRGK